MAKPRKIGKRWKMEVRRRGIHKYATFATKAEAVAWGKDMERKILGGAIEYSKDITFEYAAKRYLDEVSSNKKGFRTEKFRINKIIRNGLGGNRLYDMSTKFWKIWVAEQLKTLASSSVNRELNVISAIFEHCKELEILVENPIRGVKRPKQPKHRDRLFSEGELKAITEHLGVNPSSSKGQLSIALILAIETGMRRGELVSLDAGNIDFERRFVTLSETKNGDKRNVPLSTKAVEHLRLLGDNVFTISAERLSQLFASTCKSLGIVDLHFHDARHSAVVQLARKLDVLDLARMIGHRDIKSLMIYYNASAEEIAKRLD